MKKHLLFLIALFVACSILAAPGASTAFAAGGRPGWAGDEHHGRDDHDRGRHDRGEHRGRRQKWDRERDGRYRFNNDERRAAFNAYLEHRGDRDFREHWRGDDAPRIGYGYVIGPRYRRYCRPVPVYMMEELPPPPYGYHYYLFNGNVVLVDDGYRVQDFIHLDINLGR